MKNKFTFKLNISDKTLLFKEKIISNLNSDIYKLIDCICVNKLNENITFGYILNSIDTLF